jgi:glutamate-1-semialdehyde 2,1-aminomutase
MILDFDLDGGVRLFGAEPPRPSSGSQAATSFQYEEAIRGELRARFPGFGECHFFESRGAAVARVFEAARSLRPEGADVLRFRGCRHGHLDPPFPAAPDPSLARVIRVLESPRASDGQRFLRFGDASSLEAVFAGAGGSIACAIVEPLPLAMNLVPPPPDFLARLCATSQENGAWCVFDEGRSGMRFGARGAGWRLGVEPDALIFGEALSDGIPFGVVLVRREARGFERGHAILRDGARLPDPRALAAAADCLLRGNDPSLAPHLDSLGARLARGLDAIASDLESSLSVERFGSSVGVVFPGRSLSDPAEPFRYDWQRYAAFARGMAAGGVRIPSHPMVPMFVASAHTSSDIDRAIEVFARVLEGEIESMGGDGSRGREET